MKLYPLIAAACFGAIAFAQEPATPAPEIPFESVPNLLKLPPNLYLGEASGVAIDSKKHIFVFSRGNSTGPAYGATASQILEFGPDGTYIREIGHNLYAWAFAHTVRVDKSDNLWAVDKGTDMIIKFNPQGRVMMVFGRKKEASDEGAEPWKHPRPPLPAQDNSFRQPTDVTWDPEGNIFISDGYINSRVAKYSKEGDWVKQWGGPVPPEDRAHPKPDQLNTPHTIAADAKGNIYVGDRGNRRIQVFDHDGNFLRTIQINVPPPPLQAIHPVFGPSSPSAQAVAGQNGAPWAICITPGPTQYLYSADAMPGRIYKLTLDGQVLGVLGSSGRQMKQFGWIHELACPAENEIYAAEILNWRVQKLILHPGKTSTSTN
ncbi:MAG: peptidyl-alpha-hydroxyglycine alpha-amidating lyase family protein [Acidobacteriia bacterium]|nr:peptidyl-alpha-hydroxyglycine alpha-amidating lyase family protein [Terriglobia bacterium]